MSELSIAITDQIQTDSGATRSSRDRQPRVFGTKRGFHSSMGRKARGGWNEWEESGEITGGARASTSGGDGDVIIRRLEGM